MQLRNHAGRCRAVAVVAAAAMLTCGLATAAPAVTQTAVSVGRPCYVNANPMKGAPIKGSGSGFTPGDQVDLAVTHVFGTTTVGPEGPGLARPNAVVRYSFSGFRAGHAIYGHFKHDRKVITHRFGRAQAACGMLKTRTRRSRVGTRGSRATRSS